MIEIKPCPFCGGNAKAIHNTEDGTDKVLIECENCFAETNYYQLELSAILHWNKREQHCTQCEIGQQNLELIAENERLKAEKKKLTFMVENGLGYEDLKNDI